MNENKNSSNMEEIMQSIRDKLSDEQKAKAESCKTIDEFMQLAKNEAIELPDELMAQVIGGVDFRHMFGDSGNDDRLKIARL